MALRSTGVQITTTYTRVIDSTPSRLATMEFINTSTETFYIFLGPAAPADNNASIKLETGSSWYSQRPVDTDVWVRSEAVSGQYMQIVTEGVA